MGIWCISSFGRYSMVSGRLVVSLCLVGPWQGKSHSVMDLLVDLQGSVGFVMLSGLRYQ